MKIAMIGLGHIAKFQLDALEHLDSIRLVGAHDIRNERASLLPPSVPFYETLDEFLKNCRADLILVSTPNVTHYEIGKRVLESGYSLLLEKPCCRSESEMFDLLDTAKRQGVFFTIALHAAYARDVEWFLSQIQTGKINYGALSGFYCGFFDPYYDVNTGELKQSAQSLGGAWFDSGINALSVIGRFIAPADMKLVEGRMTVIPAIPCSEIQSSATFEFLHSGAFGQGIIETNWALGLNRKITQLFYCSTNTRVTLHHSEETIYAHRDGQLIFAKSLRNGLPRLTNHYINLFQDIEQRFRENRSNLDYAGQIHRLFFAAM